MKQTEKAVGVKRSPTRILLDGMDLVGMLETKTIAHIMAQYKASKSMVLEVLTHQFSNRRIGYTDENKVHFVGAWSQLKDTGMYKHVIALHPRKDA